MLPDTPLPVSMHSTYTFSFRETYEVISYIPSLSHESPIPWNIATGYAWLVNAIKNIRISNIFIFINKNLNNLNKFCNNKFILIKK